MCFARILLRCEDLFIIGRVDIGICITFFFHQQKGIVPNHRKTPSEPINTMPNQATVSVTRSHSDSRRRDGNFDKLAPRGSNENIDKKVKI